MFQKGEKRNYVNFFVGITALSLFILCLFFLEGEKKMERESNGEKKNTQCYVSSTTTKNIYILP